DTRDPASELLYREPGGDRRRDRHAAGGEQPQEGAAGGHGGDTTAGLADEAAVQVVPRLGVDAVEDAAGDGVVPGAEVVHEVEGPHLLGGLARGEEVAEIE